MDGDEKLRVLSGGQKKLLKLSFVFPERDNKEKLKKLMVLNGEQLPRKPFIFSKEGDTTLEKLKRLISREEGDLWNMFMENIQNVTERATKLDQSERRKLLEECLRELTMLVICRMARPKGIFFGEDEKGVIVREAMQDPKYKLMKKILMLFALWDYEDTKRQMVGKLKKYLDGEEKSLSSLNSICWAIGSIQRQYDHDFFMYVISKLEELYQNSDGKAKLAIASNIMYILGQYPIFMDQYWDFFKIVVEKLFQFMHKPDNDTRDMACHALLKIAKNSPRKFSAVQSGENKALIFGVVRGLWTTITTHNIHQISILYESMAHVIKSEVVYEKKDGYVVFLMEYFNKLLEHTCEHIERLNSKEAIECILKILESNISVVSVLGDTFLVQMIWINPHLKTLYSMCTRIIGKGAPHVSRTSEQELLMDVKGKILKLIETAIGKMGYKSHHLDIFVAPMREAVSEEYKNGLDALQFEVLSFYGTLIMGFKSKVNVMGHDAANIVNAFFSCPCRPEDMLGIFRHHPEHGLRFLFLLQAILTHFSKPFISEINEVNSDFVMNTIAVAIEHKDFHLAKSGITFLTDLLKEHEESSSEICNKFHSRYFLQLKAFMFKILSNELHRNDFERHVWVLRHLFSLVKSGKLEHPLNDTSHVREHSVKCLVTLFPNKLGAEVDTFVDHLFASESDNPTFESHIRNFFSVFA